MPAESGGEDKGAEVHEHFSVRLRKNHYKKHRFSSLVTVESHKNSLLSVSNGMKRSHKILTDEEVKAGKCTSWMELEISGPVKNLSQDLWKFHHLTALFLNGNQLTKIPPEISSLSALKILDLSHNNLKTVPSQLGEVVTLCHLYLNSNLLRVLPYEIGNLFRLQTLGLHGNPLSPEITRIYNESRGTTKLLQFLLDNLSFNTTSTPSRSWVPISQVAAHKTVAKFTILCYNILCDKYATPSLYSYCPTWALDWEYRKAKISEEINQFDADIVTLQEVETHEYWHHFQPMLAQKGYDGLFSAKSRAKTMAEHEKRFVDGCAIFWKTNKFSLVADHLVEFTQLAIDHAQGSEQMLNRVMTRDNIGLVAVLNIKESIYDGEPPVDAAEWVTGGPLVVCTAHIHWDPEFCDVKLIQAMMLVHELRTILDQTAKNWVSLLEASNQAEQQGGVKSAKTGGIRKATTGGSFKVLAGGGEGEPRSPRRASVDVPTVGRNSSAKTILTRNAASASPIDAIVGERGDGGGGGDSLAASSTPLSSSLPCSDASITSSSSPSLNSSTADDNNYCDAAAGARKNETDSPAGRLLTKDIPLLICGDLNSLPDSGVVEFLSTGRISVKHDDFKKFRDDPCMERFGATLEDRDSNYYVHELGIQSAYNMDIMPFTNFTFDFKGIIDYMFATVHSLHRLGVLGPVEPDWFIQNKVIGCPHPLVPSDHFPILSQYAIIPPNLRSEEAQLAYMHAAAAKAAAAAASVSTTAADSAAATSVADQAAMMDRPFDINGLLGNRGVNVNGGDGVRSRHSALAKVIAGLHPQQQPHQQHLHQHLQSSASHPSLQPHHQHLSMHDQQPQHHQQGFSGPSSLHHHHHHQQQQQSILQQQQYQNAQHPHSHHHRQQHSSHNTLHQHPHRSTSGSVLSSMISNGAGGAASLPSGGMESGTGSSSASDLGGGSNSVGGVASNNNMASSIRRLNSIPTPPSSQQQHQQQQLQQRQQLQQQMLYNHNTGGRRQPLQQSQLMRSGSVGQPPHSQNITSIGALDPAITSVSSLARDGTGNTGSSGVVGLGGMLNGSGGGSSLRSLSGGDGGIMGMLNGGVASSSSQSSISNELFHQLAGGNGGIGGHSSNGLGGGDQHHSYSSYQGEIGNSGSGRGCSGAEFFRNVGAAGGSLTTGQQQHEHQPLKLQQQQQPAASTPSNVVSSGGVMGSDNFLSSTPAAAIASAFQQQSPYGSGAARAQSATNQAPLSDQTSALNALLDSHGFSSLISGEGGSRWGDTPSSTGITRLDLNGDGAQPPRSS